MTITQCLIRIILCLLVLSIYQSQESKLDVLKDQILDIRLQRDTYEYNFVHCKRMLK